VPHNQFLSRRQLVVRIPALARTGPIEMVHIAEPLVSGVGFAAEGFSRRGRFGWERHIDAVTVGVDQYAVFAEGSEQGKR
jgi:hypothetical protein